MPVGRVAALDDAVLALKAEWDENVCQCPMTATETMELARRIEELEQPAAKDRQAKAGPKEGRGVKATGSGNLPELVNGRVRDKVAAAVGLSGKTYEKLKQVYAAADRARSR